jgi:hypothetical protein
MGWNPYSESIGFAPGADDEMYVRLSSGKLIQAIDEALNEHGMQLQEPLCIFCTYKTDLPAYVRMKPRLRDPSPYLPLSYTPTDPYGDGPGC